MIAELIQAGARGAAGVHGDGRYAVNRPTRAKSIRVPGNQ